MTSATKQIEFDQLEIFVPDHLDTTADLDALHYPRLAERQPFVMYTKHHFEIELKLTPCARLLWQWVLLKAPAGIKTGIDLRDFQAICAEQRRGRPYCMKQIRNAFKELEELELLVDLTDKRQVIARHPGPVTNETTSPQLRKLISKARKLTSTPPYIDKYSDLSPDRGENLNRQSREEEVAVNSTLELVASLQAQINVLVASLNSDRDKFSAPGHQDKTRGFSGNIHVEAQGPAVGFTGDIHVEAQGSAVGFEGEIEVESQEGSATGFEGDIEVGSQEGSATGFDGEIKAHSKTGSAKGFDGEIRVKAPKGEAVGFKGRIEVSQGVKEVWEIAPGQPYPAFLNWKEAINILQGGRWEKNAAAFAYSEFYNNRVRTNQVLWPQFMQEVKAIVEHNNQLRAAGMDVILPSWFAAQRPDATEANVAQLMANLEEILPLAKVASKEGVIPYEQATNTEIAPLPVLESPPALKPAAKLPQPSAKKPGKKKSLNEILEIAKGFGQSETCKQV